MARQWQVADFCAQVITYGDYTFSRCACASVNNNHFYQLSFYESTGYYHHAITKRKGKILKDNAKIEATFTTYDPYSDRSKRCCCREK